MSLKNIIKNLLFNAASPNRIRFGIGSGMMAHYDPGNRSQHLLGLYEREINPYLKTGIEQADLLVDIGANDGYYGLAFARHKGKEIFLCEPGRVKADLVNNMIINGFKEGKDFKLVDRLVSGRTNDQEISINDLLHDKDNIFILMDVDGAEENILRAFDFSSKKKVDWLIETHSPLLEKNIVSIFASNNYKVTIIKNAWWRKIIPEQRPLLHNRWLFATIINQ